MNLDKLTFDIRIYISELLGVEYSLYLNQYKIWNKKAFKILLSFENVFSAVHHLLIVVSGNLKGYTLAYSEMFQNPRFLIENCNFETLNKQFLILCNAFVSDVYVYEKIILTTQGHKMEIDTIEQDTFLKLLKLDPCNCNQCKTI